MIKYAIHPGWVVSKNDGDNHYINYSQLIRLYGLNPNECINWEFDSIGRNPRNYKHFYPNYHGDYELEVGQEVRNDTQ